MGLSYACVTVSVQIPLRVIQVVDISDNPNSPFTEKDGISLNVMDTQHRKFVPFDIGFFLILILNNNGTNEHALH